MQPPTHARPERQRAGSGAHIDLLGQVGGVLALGEHRRLVPADPLGAPAGAVGDLLRGQPGAHHGLDLAGPDRAVDLDLELAEPRTVAARSGLEALIEREQVTSPVTIGEQQVLSALMHADEAQLRVGHDSEGAKRRASRQGATRWNCGKSGLIG